MKRISQQITGVRLPGLFEVTFDASFDQECRSEIIAMIRNGEFAEIIQTGNFPMMQKSFELFEAGVKNMEVIYEAK